MDRRVATAVVAIAAMLMTIVVASTLDNRGREPERLLRDLVQFATRADQLDSRIQYHLERTVPSGRSLLVDFWTWRRAKPQLIVREDTASLVADNAQTHFECRDEDDGVRCFSSPSRLTTNSTAELYFAAVRVAKSYRLVERASLRIAGERATCIELIGQRDAKRLSVLGDRLQLCFASDGALLLSDRWSAQSHDRQTAQRVQRGFNVPSYTKLLERFRPRIASGGQKG